MRMRRKRRKRVKGGDVWREDWHPAREGLGKEPPKQASCCRDIWRSGDLRTARFGGCVCKANRCRGGLGDSERGRKGRDLGRTEERVRGWAGGWTDTGRGDGDLRSAEEFAAAR